MILGDRKGRPYVGVTEIENPRICNADPGKLILLET